MNEEKRHKAVMCPITSPAGSSAGFAVWTIGVETALYAFASAGKGLCVMSITLKLTLKRVLLLMALAVAAGLSLYGGWDQIVGGLAESWSDKSWARFWGLAAHWLGLGGIQVAAIVLAIIFAHFFRHRRMRMFSLKSLAAFILSGLAVQTVKLLAGRPRPRLGAIPWDAFALSLNGGLNSFPSGHATTSFTLAAILATRFPRASWLFYGLACFIALGRVVGGSHYLSDVIAGSFLGLAVGWSLSPWLTKKHSSPVADQRSNPSREMRGSGHA